MSGTELKPQPTNDEPVLSETPHAATSSIRAESPQDESAVKDGSDSGNLATLARRITRRTTDALVIVIVGFGLYSVGDQVAEWWKSPDVEVIPPADIDLGNVSWDLTGTGVELKFGDQPLVVSRSETHGSAVEARDHLIRNCLKWSEAADTVDGVRPIREQRLIQLLSAHAPVLEHEDIRIYAFNAPQIVAIGIRKVPQQAGEPVDVVACWSVLIPEAGNQWGLLAFRPAESTSGVAGVDLKIPAGSRSSVSIGQPGNSYVLGFDGEGSTQDWADDIHAQLERQGYVQVVRRAPSDDALAIRWVSQHDESKPAVDLLVEARVDGSHHGLLTVTPPQQDNQPSNDP